MKKYIAIWTFAFVLAAAPAGFAAEEGAQDIPDAVVKKVDPSVVAIQHEKAGGSGFVVTKDGYILTNGHVVQGSDGDPTQPAKSITVILNDERKYSAKVIGFCMDPDVALIKIEPSAPLIPAEFADSRAAQIGQKCFAVGTPVGLKRTFTSGILSNVERTDLDTFTTVLQTDAAINSGNSGGPLFDREGKVLGINTYASRGRNNLGFTIPIHVAQVLRQHFLDHGRFVRSDIPVFFGSELYDELALSMGVKDGILITYVMKDAPADKAGLKADDILVEKNGEKVSARTRAELLDFDWAWTTSKPGTKLKLKVLRGPKGQRKPVMLNAALEEIEPMPQLGREKGELKEFRYGSLGLGFKRIVRLHRVVNGLSDVPGVLVTRSDRNSPANKAGLARMDIITHVAGNPVSDVDSFREALESHLRNQEKAIELTVRQKKSTTSTALAPYYDLQGKRIALVVPAAPTDDLDLLVRELVTDGAEVVLATPKGVKSKKAKQRLKGLKGDAFDVVLFADGKGASKLWEDKDALRLVREAHENEKILAAVGASALTLVIAVPDLLEKKITTTKENSSEAMKLKANYTGKGVEKDGSVITTTAFDRKTVREFLKTLRILARNAD